MNILNNVAIACFVFGYICVGIIMYDKIPDKFKDVYVVITAVIIISLLKY